MNRVRAWMVLGVLAVACDPEAGGDDPVGAPAEPESVDTEALPDEAFTFAPDPEEGTVAPRRRRRVDLDQLDRSFRVVSGGFGWTRRSGRTEVNRFDELAATLGVPDYIETVDEDLSPSPMFSKFLDDAARSVCDRWLSADRSREAAERTFYGEVDPEASFSADPEAARKNVARLLLRAHGRRANPGDAVVSRWTRLLEAAESDGLEPDRGWRAVCVGLFTHPDFYLY